MTYALYPPEITAPMIGAGAGPATLHAASAAYAELAALYKTITEARNVQGKNITTNLMSTQTTPAVVKEFIRITHTLEQAAKHFLSLSGDLASVAENFTAMLAAHANTATITALDTSFEIMSIINPLVLGLLTPAIIANRAVWAADWALNSTLLTEYDAITKIANIARTAPQSLRSLTSSPFTQLAAAAPPQTPPAEPFPANIPLVAGASDLLWNKILTAPIDAGFTATKTIYNIANRTVDAINTLVNPFSMGIGVSNTTNFTHYFRTIIDTIARGSFIYNNSHGLSLATPLGSFSIIEAFAISASLQFDPNGLSIAISVAPTLGAAIEQPNIWEVATAWNPKISIGQGFLLNQPSLAYDGFQSTIHGTIDQNNHTINIRPTLLDTPLGSFSAQIGQLARSVATGEASSIGSAAVPGLNVATASTYSDAGGFATNYAAPATSVQPFLAQYNFLERYSGGDQAAAARALRAVTNRHGTLAFAQAAGSASTFPYDPPQISLAPLIPILFGSVPGAALTALITTGSPASAAASASAAAVKFFGDRITRHGDGHGHGDVPEEQTVGSVEHTTSSGQTPNIPQGNNPSKSNNNNKSHNNSCDDNDEVVGSLSRSDVDGDTPRFSLHDPHPHTGCLLDDLVGSPSFENLSTLHHIGNPPVKHAGASGAFLAVENTVLFASSAVTAGVIAHDLKLSSLAMSYLKPMFRALFSKDNESSPTKTPKQDMIKGTVKEKQTPQENNSTHTRNQGL